MALTKDRIPNNTQMGLAQAYTYYGNVFGGSSAHQVSDQSYQPDQGAAAAAQSVINFKTAAGYNNIMHSNGGSSFLSFDQNPDHHQNANPDKIADQQLDHDHHDYSIWEDNLIQDFGGIQSTSSYGAADQQFGWPNSEENLSCANSFQEFGKQEDGFNKRPHKGESMQVNKKQCTSTARKTKPKPTAPSKDPQSVAAKNRRERISERLKVLQELVPNGSKVDLVTMLEKAISYVKFLQLQVKVLATDEFWPAQGGSAPDISQVKEAIDAILSSQKDRNSSSE
ncbi:hypothetical protein Vadar_028390 [Vaccinium darrowii]|uniref:Uncharacterized protein n=1 Tax=Vaccinium darrowii TaxID=229202 RepID=A0ACB7YGX4_9ERIC|nr:hypothetical protein Vadar_028390 [Vaccinium darrowii]